MLQRGAQVLPEGDDADARAAQILEGAQHLLVALSEAHHHAALGHGAPLAEVAQRLEAGAVPGPGAQRGGEALDRFDVVAHDVGRRGEDRIQQLGPCVEVGNEQFDDRVGIAAADGLDGRGPVGGTAVGQVVARDGGDDGVAQPHQRDALGHLLRLVGIGREGSARAGGAEAAPPRAYLAQNHEGRRAAAPALGLVGALPAAAYRMQPPLLDDFTHARELVGTVEADLQPVGFFQDISPVMQLRHLSSLFSQLTQK